MSPPPPSIPSNARDIRAGIAKFVDNGLCGVLWTSHNMYEVQAVCDRVLFLSHGRIVLEGDPKTLPEEHGAATSRRPVRQRRARGAATGAADERLAHRRDRVADVLSLSRQPAAHLSHLHLCRDRYLGLGFSHPLPQFRFACGLQFRAGAARRGAAVGFPDPRHAATDDDVVRGRVDAKFPQFLRLSACARPNI